MVVGNQPQKCPCVSLMIKKNVLHRIIVSGELKNNGTNAGTHEDRR